MHMYMYMSMSMYVVAPSPSQVRWKPHEIYACFLSHYKMEAASDARYIHDMLRKMLQSPVFLDVTDPTRTLEHQPFVSRHY